MNIHKRDIIIKRLLRETILTYSQIAYKMGCSIEYVERLDDKIRGYEGSLMYNKIIEELTYSNLSKPQIANKYSISIRIVERISANNHIRTYGCRMGPEYVKELDAKIVELLKRNYRIKDIMDELEVSSAYIIKVKSRSRYITYKERKIIELIQMGKSMQEIATELGCSNSVIAKTKNKYKIKKGK